MAMPASEARGLLTLPSELLVPILEYVFADNLLIDSFKNRNARAGIVLDEGYASSAKLQLLLTCRRLYEDGNLVAFKYTPFIVNNLFVANNVPDRLATLHPKQVASLRSIAFIADAKHFRKLVDWGEHPFSIPALNLDTLTIVLHRSSFWHYLYDFTSGIAKLLRNLQGVRRLVFVRNQALVKGSFKAWYNRLVGLMMKVDHFERYDRCPSNPEKVWWTWHWNELAQSFCLEAAPSKAFVGEEEYMQQIKPLMEDLKVSIESEEYNHDPRTRIGF